MGDWKLRGKAAAVGLLALTSLGGVQGCAEERDPINRVQPLAVPKSIFVKQDASGQYLDDSASWYFRATITDVPATQSAGFVGAAGDMYRVKWRIDEGYLVAYREDPDVLNSGDPHGGRVAAFPILSHFDVRYAYNANTGEEANVVEENTVDRPWQQRDYMRVDWSNNKLSDAGFVAPGFDSFSAVTDFVQDEKSPDHPTFQGDYVDITARYTVMPSIATCYYYYRDYGCGPGDISARLSFMKVPERDFEIREYPDRMPLLDNDGNPIRSPSGSQVSLPMMDQFGFFRTERATYDQRYGSLEKRFLYRANVWNLWQSTVARDADGNKLKFESGDFVPLEYKARKVRPIVYFLNADWPVELRGIAQETADAWNDAFSETVAGLRLLEGRDPGSALDMGELRAEVAAMKTRDVGYGATFGERVFVLCQNNPVKEGDHPACGKPGDIARQGDLRYSFMHWVPKPQPSGPLGFGPSYPDPITGQLFSANAYIYGAALDTYAQQAVDIVNLLNGRYNEFDYANGIATDAYAKRLKDGVVPGTQGTARAGLESMTPGRADFNLAKTQAHVSSMVDRPLLKTIAQKGVPIANGPSGKDRLAMIRGTALERKLLDNPETHLLVGKLPDTSLDDKDIKSIGDILFSQAEGTKKENERLAFLGKHGCYLDASMVDDSVVGLAREMAEKYKNRGNSPAEQEKVQHEMWNDMRRHILRGVLEHEVGHTVGLRHNFEGSSDALNFHDEFWRLKQENLKFGAPMTEAQKNGKMTELQYTTVMDYGARFNSDIHSLGKYDYAAIRFGYGNMVESFPKGKLKDILYNASPDQFGSGGFFTGYSAEILDEVNRNYRHYTQIPSEFEGGIGAIATNSRQIRPFADVAENARKLYLKGAANTTTVKTNAQFGGIDVVPYQYCGDEFAGSANRPLCQRWDQGMDSYEVVSDAIDRYKQYYIFDAFTRGKVTGINMLRGYLSKIATRYFGHVHSQYIHWLFYQGTFDYYWTSIFKGDAGVKAGYITNADWFKDPAGGLPATLATTWGLDRLIDVLATPDVGVYVPNQDHALYPDKSFFEQATSSVYACSDGSGGTVKCDSNANQLSLDIDTGARYRFTRYDGASGQGYFNRIRNIGSFYDKIAALITLTNSETNFVGQDQTNAVSYRIGFYLAYPKALSSIFGGVATDAYDNYAWRYDTSSFGGDGTVKLYSPNVFQSMGGDDKVAMSTSLKGKPVDAGWYFFYKAYAMYFSMAEFQSNFSQSWNDATRVWCVGCGEAFTPSAGSTPITMSDPLSGKQYAALVYGDGRYSPGAEFIKQGQKLVTDYQDRLAAPADAKDRDYYINRARARLQDHVELMDLIRGLYQVYGYTRF
ncbi:MAG: zinc-dependent metalloprotease [Deltaproteobacteria bacterium]|nr:zinc-dependent metalloprotease [Deltaproteobacteria bacterium]